MGLASGKRREGEQQWAVRRTNLVVTVSRGLHPRPARSHTWCFRGLPRSAFRHSVTWRCPTPLPPHGLQPTRPLCPWIVQARILDWVAISFSNAGKWKVKSESKVAQSCLTLSDPMECSPPGSSIHGIFQARVLEWGAIAFSIHMHIANIIYRIQSTLYMHIAYSLYTHIDYTLYMHIIAILCIWQGSDLFHTLTTQYDMKFKVHETLKRKINVNSSSGQQQRHF